MAEIANPEPVGLEFPFAAVCEELEFTAHADRAKDVDLRINTWTPTRALSFAVRNAAVKRGDVCDLVAEHRCKFGFAIEMRDEATRDVDESTRDGESVLRFLVEEPKLPRKLWPF